MKTAIGRKRRGIVNSRLNASLLLKAAALPAWIPLTQAHVVRAKTAWKSA